MSIEVFSVLVTAWVAIATFRYYLRAQRRRDHLSAVRLHMLMARLVDDETTGAEQRKIAEAYLSNPKALAGFSSSEPFLTKENASRWGETLMELAIWIPFAILVFSMFWSAFVTGEQ